MFLSEEIEEQPFERSKLSEIFGGLPLHSEINTDWLPSFARNDFHSFFNQPELELTQNQPSNYSSQIPNIDLKKENLSLPPLNNKRFAKFDERKRRFDDYDSNFEQEKKRIQKDKIKDTPLDNEIEELSEKLEMSVLSERKAEQSEEERAKERLERINSFLHEQSYEDLRKQLLHSNNNNSTLSQNL